MQSDLAVSIGQELSLKTRVLGIQFRNGALGGTAVVIGFAGIVLILRPGSEIFTPWSLLPIGAALGYASAAVTVRLITEEVPSSLTNLNSHLGALVGSTVLTLATCGYEPVAILEDWLWIIAMATLGGSGVLRLSPGQAQQAGALRLLRDRLRPESIS